MLLTIISKLAQPRTVAQKLLLTQQLANDATGSETPASNSTMLTIGRLKADRLLGTLKQFSIKTSMRLTAVEMLVNSAIIVIN